MSRFLYIDATDLILGRLASFVAKQLLLGYNVRILRSEQAFQTGEWTKVLAKMKSYLRKRTNYNPKKGPLHQRAPSEIIKRAVRRMLPIRTVRGKEAYKRLKAFEGIPNSFRNEKLMSIESALRFYCIKPDTSIVQLARLAGETGWNKRNIVEKLENKRLKELEIEKEKKNEKIKKVNDFELKNERIQQINKEIEELMRI